MANRDQPLGWLLQLHVHVQRTAQRVHQGQNEHLHENLSGKGDFLYSNLIYSKLKKNKIKKKQIQKKFPIFPFAYLLRDCSALCYWMRCRHEKYEF